MTGREISPKSLTNINGATLKVENTAAVRGPPKQAPVSKLDQIRAQVRLPRSAWCVPMYDEKSVVIIRRQERFPDPKEVFLGLVCDGTFGLIPA